MIAWSAVFAASDDSSAPWDEAPLPSPQAVKSRLGLTVDLTPVQVVAAANRLDQLVADGWSQRAVPAIRDIAQVATPTRIQALSHWLAAGYTLAAARPGQSHSGDILWLAYETPQARVPEWREVLAALG
ncbi:hypothetical protein AB0J83_03375 [Actinoplanes sp. NPDC049596]|uniref:hypothetical protein n=1 Tax=unclassified Actinoplanes TaxID=2626549 RepID=UPI003427227E